MASASNYSYRQQPTREWTTNGGAENYHFSSSIDPTRPRGLDMTASPISPTLPIQNPADYDAQSAKKARSTSSAKAPTAARPHSQEAVDSVTKPTKDKKKSKGLLSRLTLKDPSTAAFEEYAKQQKLQAKDGRKNSVVGVSSQKLPDSVPKVNSKWDGLPQSAQQKPKHSIDRRDSGISGRVPPSLHTIRAATLGKSSASPAASSAASPNEPLYSPAASSTALPNDSRRKEFPFNMSTSSTRSQTRGASPSETSSQRTIRSPVESQKVQPVSSGALPPPSKHDPLPAIPSVSSLVDEMALPSQTDNAETTLRPMGGVSKARVEAYVRDQAGRETRGSSRSSQQRDTSDAAQAASRQQRAHMSPNASVAASDVSRNDYARSIASSHGAQTSYTTPSTDASNQKHTRQLSSSRSEHSYTSPLIGSSDTTSTQGTPRRNFSRPLAGISRSPSTSIPAIPTAIYELHTPTSRNSTTIDPPAPVELGPPAKLPSLLCEPTSYTYREPSREIRLQNHDIVEAPTDTERDVEESSSQPRTIPTYIPPVIGKGDFRLEKPFDPTASWDGIEVPRR
ncbi:hypothetical protein MBLNU457_g0814t1 [Dothideomycetes sp. NU457]